MSSPALLEVSGAEIAPTVHASTGCVDIGQALLMCEMFLLCLLEVGPDLLRLLADLQQNVVGLGVCSTMYHPCYSEGILA